MRIFLALVVVLPLAGCQTDQERMAEYKARNDALDDQTCRKYGAKSGTDIYIQCRMSEAQRRTTAESAPGPVIVNNNVDTTPHPSLYPTIQPMNIPGPRCTSRGPGC
jgi:hypothetical protein